MNCDKLRPCYIDCNDRCKCRKELFNFEHGYYAYFENCVKCSKEKDIEYVDIPYCYLFLVKC